MIGDDVIFAIAAPEEWSYVDLLSPDVPRWAGRQLGGTLAAARAGTPKARMLMLRSMVAYTPSGEPLTFGLTVALADRDTPVAQTPLEEYSMPDAELSALQAPVGSGIRIVRINATPALPDSGPVPILSVQYALETALGLLTIGFSTAQAAPPEAWLPLFDAMVATAELA